MATSKTKTLKLICTFQWVKVVRPDEKSGKYQVTCTDLSEAAVAAIEAIQPGATVVKDGKATLKIKSKTPPKVKDADGEFLTVVDAEGNVTAPRGLIGNGSKGVATVFPFYNATYGKHSFLINEIKVTDLVVYDPDSDEGAL